MRSRHVANGDMVTLALIQGVVNTFVIVASRVVGHLVDRVVFKTERGHGPAFFITSILAQVVFGILASTIVFYFSRQREFRADAGAATLSGAAQDDSAPWRNCSAASISRICRSRWPPSAFPASAAAGSSACL